MCMMLYIGSDIVLPIVPFKEDSPGFHTEELCENDLKISGHFSTKNILYAGSSQGCGCGFQHSLIDNNTGWLIVEDEDEDFTTNMLQLHEYVKNILEKGGKVELYACWDGEFQDAPMSREDISLQDLIDKRFYLKEKGFYTVE